MAYLEILAIHYKIMIRYIGLILMIIALSLLSPLFALFFNPQDIIYIQYFIIAAILAFTIGLIFYFKIGEKNESISLTLKEGGIIVVFSWILAIFFSVIPFVWGLDLNWTQGIFEVVSAWTTTGLSVLNVEQTPAIYLLYRSIMQMLGGAGLAVIALSSILPMQGMGLYMAEAREDQLLPHVRHSTNMIMRIYLAYIISGSFLYFISGMDLFNAINHSMAAISTGGFSTVEASIGHFDSISIELVTIVLMFLGTINFATHYALVQGKFKKFFHNGEIRLMFFLLVMFIPILTFFSLQGLYQSFGESLRKVIFQLVSALSTTGFSTIEFNLWPLFANMIIIVLMIIGGGSGSTAGGIKQFRIYLMIKSICWEIKKQFIPQNQVTEYYVWRGEDKWYVKNEHIREVANYIFLFLITYIIGVLIFLAHGYPLLDSMFEFASAIGTVGLSVGITSASAPPLILWTNIFGMFLGRLEILIIIFTIVKLFKDGLYAVKITKSK